MHASQAFIQLILKALVFCFIFWSSCVGVLGLRQRLSETPLILGAQNGSVEVVAALLEEDDTDVAAVNVRPYMFGLSQPGI